MRSVVTDGLSYFQSGRAKKASTKNPWSEAEKTAVCGGMALHIRKRTVPGKRECEELKRSQPVLKNRDWTLIKYFVKNRIDSNLKK